jgi:hypothetical protein
MVDIDSFLLIAAGLSIIGGIVFGLYYNRIISLFYKRKKDIDQSQNSKVKEEEEEKEKEKMQKTDSNLIKKNSHLLQDEIKIYQFEKDLVSHAIENILTASKNKLIDTFEKDRLLLKYDIQVKKLNEKMEKIQSEIDVTKLIDLRNDLASLLDNKISVIDEKIKEINFKIGTNYKILEIKNHNKQNKDSANNNVNSTNSSSIEETIDVNLNSRKLINYKNIDTNKKKENVIDAERKKIGDLKDQVVLALNRLDRAEDIKEEIENEAATTIQDNKNRKHFADEEIKNSLQNAYEFNDKDHLHIANKIPLNTAIKNSVTATPAIFGFMQQGIQSKNDIITTNAIPNPSHERDITKNSIINNDDSQNKIKKENSFMNVNQIKNKYNNNKSNPLSNILNHTELKFDPYMEIKEEEEEKVKEKDIVESQSKDKQHHKKGSYNRFKFPLRFIFSKTIKKKNKENKISNNNTKRRDSLSNILTNKER